MKNQLLLFLTLVLSISSFYAVNVHDTLYITRKMDTIAFLPADMCVFSQSENYQRQNTNYHLSVGDTLFVSVINTDSLIHSFTVDSVLEIGNDILPGDTGIYVLPFIAEGSYAYYSNKNYGKALGASGLIQIGYPNASHYYWNLFDQDTLLAKEIAEGIVTGPSSGYRPNIFMINNLNHPITLSDPEQYVSNAVGDSIVISVYNSGKMDHVLHFHGYHVTILESRMSMHQIGWEKDTFPVLLNELMTILLVPDQPGIYPVHDHNLVTLTTGAYPGGMMTRLNITP